MLDCELQKNVFTDKLLTVKGYFGSNIIGFSTRLPSEAVARTLHLRFYGSFGYDAIAGSQSVKK